MWRYCKVLLQPTRKLRRLSGYKEEYRKTQKKLRRLIRHLGPLLTDAVRGRSIQNLESILGVLDTDEVRQLNKVVIMGMCRLLMEFGKDSSAYSLLNKYLNSEENDYRFWYFLEPLLALESKGLIKQGALLDFCTTLKPPYGAGALDWLRKGYKPADDADKTNFEELIITPLTTVGELANNLMDIRFDPLQRQSLVSTIKKCLEHERQFSLIRLGDGEAYPFSIPVVNGFDRGLFESDIKTFELHMWGTFPAPERFRADFKKRFLSAVANTDVLGIPSIYRVIRNLTPPYTRYGIRRNQRGFMRILSSLGAEIPMHDKIFTEERCQRVRGAVDKALISELVNLAPSTVVVTRHEHLSSRFDRTVKSIIVPASPRKLFKIYPEVIKRVRNVSRPGTLVLAGAGQVAKVLVDEARSCGAVALDVGSLMDYMVGLRTRTIADLV